MLPCIRLRPTVALLAALCAVAASAAGRSEVPTVLAVCEGSAGADGGARAAAFALAAESSLKLVYEVSPDADGTPSKATVRLQRKLPNGSFVTVKTIADATEGGETDAKPFPAGEYKLEVKAVSAKFRVLAVKE